MANILKKDNALPRGYLSWSQLSLWEKDPNLYYQIYIDGMDMIRTPYLKLGTRLDEAIQNGQDEFGDPMINYLVIMFPKYPKMQYRIEIEFEGINLVGVLDGFSSLRKKLVIGEYKSGQKFTQSKADKLGQLDMYALLVWKKFGRLPDKIKLHWAETKVKENEEGKKEVFFTGKIKTFETTRTMKNLILMGGRIHKAYKEISKMWKGFGY
ncbi:hypothetical protein LCGC14_0641520 [marine sediment metagenome]|uniref:PD-(D/E)XK endonuclease-like domain-containing protein n=1 Tax=marine sediment metagenome TaxID=412755 RepID=A0A0F9RIH4_9ZZZZ